MAHAQRADARLRQPVVQPGSRTVAKIRAHRLVDWCEHLEQDKNNARQGQRSTQILPSLYSANQNAHRDAKHSRQDSAQQQDRPPQSRKSRVSFWQDPEKDPLIPAADIRQGRKHQKNNLLHDRYDTEAV